MNSFAKGMVVGLVVGAIASIVLMPDSGRELADKAREKAKEFSKKFKSKSRELADIEEETDEFLSALVKRGKMTKRDAIELKESLVELIK